MALGFHLIRPNSRPRYVKAQSMEDRLAIVNEELERYGAYILRNWDKDDGTPWPPNAKVKRQLDCLADFLLRGNADDIVTDYKRKANRSREVPMSSCPSYMQNIVDSSVIATGDAQATEETRLFRGMMEEIMPPPEEKKTRKQRKPDRFDRVRSVGAKSFERCIVNTDGDFQFNGETYHVTDSRYDGVPSRLGDFYAMDRIIVATMPDGSLKFFDMNFHKVSEVRRICQNN